MSQDCAQRLTNRAMMILALREHSISELKRKLSQKLPDCAEQITSTLTELEQSGWLSEVRFVEASIRKAVSAGHGEMRLKLTLKQHGIAADMVTELLQLAEIDWFSVAKQAREKRFGIELPQDRQEMAQQVRFLSYRGFDSDMIWRLLKNDS